MPIHIGDYKRDTGHLRAAGHGAYLLLLFHHWSTGSLPTDDEQLSAIACMTKQEWKKHKPILARFFGEGWVHGRVVSDLKDANESYEKLAAAGSKGGKARAERKRCYSEATSEASSDTIARLKQPITDNHEEDRIVDARAGASVFTEGSKALANAFWKAVGITDKLQIPPQLAGVDWRALGWEQAGFTVDLIETEARRTGPDKPLSYHEKVFATAFAKRQAPLPVVEVKQAETITVTKHGTSNNQSGSLIASIKRELAEIEAEESTDLALPADDFLRLSDRSIR